MQMKANSSNSSAQPIKAMKSRKDSHSGSSRIGKKPLGKPVIPQLIIDEQTKSSMLTEPEIETLASAIIEVGGPYWERILALHGAQGSRSTTLSTRQPYHLWNAVSHMYCHCFESNAAELPGWLRLAAKSLTLQSSGLREKEVIQAAYDAYGWTDDEDNAILESLKEVGAPEWAKVHSLFTAKVTKTERSQRDVEARAVVLHRYHTFYHDIELPEGLIYLRTERLNSFGVPWNLAWTEEEDATLLEGIKQLKGPYWGKILALYGASGIHNHTLAAKSEVDLAGRAREWWTAASGPQSSSINDDILDGLQYLQPKGLTASGFPTSRGWSDDQDKVLLAELAELKSPNYNEILLRHGVHGRISERLAPKNYAQLRGRALKIYNFCIREGKPLPPGLQYAKRGAAGDRDDNNIHHSDEKEIQKRKT